jgi:uncharacterized protein (DUF433 family)
LFFVSADQLAAFVESHTEIQGGAVVFRGTRVPLRALFDHLAAGESVDDFLDGFRTVKREQVLGVLAALRDEALAAVG